MDPFAKLILKAERILLSTHANPDGDGLGSMMALHTYLKKVGKTSLPINPGPTPEKFQLVDPKGEIQVFQGGDLPEVDLILVLDTNDARMMGPMEAPLAESPARLVFVDHHIPEASHGGENHLIDESYAATGELVYDLLRHLKADVDKQMALAVYVAILTDTGSFRFKRTSARSHEIAAQLLKRGVAPEEVFQGVYARNSLAKTRLFGHVLENIQVRAEGKLAWITIPKATRLGFGATVEDTEAFVNQLTLVEGVSIALMFREEDDGRVKVSLRGIGDVAVVGIAKKFGGGGHRHAAGMRVAQTLDQVVSEVVAEAEKTLQLFPS